MKRITILVLVIMVTMGTYGECPDKCANPKTDSECKECAQQFASNSLTFKGIKLTFEQGVRPKWLKMGGQAFCSIELVDKLFVKIDDDGKCQTVWNELLKECVGYDVDLSGFVMRNGPSMCEVAFKGVQV